MTAHRPTAPWEELSRNVPAWFLDAKLGIFVHWGAYSVPAWAEPTGELGAVDEATWFRHNPYAEWYFNTIRLDDSPARAHHREMYGGAPYDDFLDRWQAEAFDPGSWTALFARAGARYVVPTTKHHDGIALWDAPGTGTRNTVHRGPRRDLVADLAGATRAAGMRFGVYYSGGLDWHVTDLPPLDSDRALHDRRPVDAAYAAYAYLHVRDLIDRHQPDVLWNDIEWPDAGKHDGSLGLFELFEHYYATVPDGVVNDRWGETHRDYRTSEYQLGREHETADAWENCRGIGLSFGYNQLENASHVLDGPAIVRHLADVVSRGGNLLLNVGPTASGEIPELQRRALEQLADWMAANRTAIHDTRPLPAVIATASEVPWARWTRAGTTAYVVLDAAGPVRLPVTPGAMDAASARLLDGTPVTAREDGGELVFEGPMPDGAGPVVVAFDLRA
jgi:alpha-L-fucosidase